MVLVKNNGLIGLYCHSISFNAGVLCRREKYRPYMDCYFMKSIMKLICKMLECLKKREIFLYEGKFNRVVAGSCEQVRGT